MTQQRAAESGGRFFPEFIDDIEAGLPKRSLFRLQSTSLTANSHSGNCVHGEPTRRAKSPPRRLPTQRAFPLQIVPLLLNRRSRSCKRRCSPISFQTPNVFARGGQLENANSTYAAVLPLHGFSSVPTTNVIDTVVRPPDISRKKQRFLSPN